MVNFSVFFPFFPSAFVLCILKLCHRNTHTFMITSSWWIYREACHAAFHGVAKSWTWLGDWTTSISSVPFSHSVVFNSLQPHGLQHTRLPCPSLSPGVCSNLYPWVGDAIQPSHPLSSPSLPALNLPQHQGLFQWVSSSHQVANYWSLSFSISPSKEYSGLISFRIDWFDLPVVQRTLKSLLQHHRFKLIFGAQSSLWSSSHICTWLLEKP